MSEQRDAHRQIGYRLRMEWGLIGAAAISAGCDIAVVVDVLSFTTALSVAANRGIIVFPYPWRDERAESFAADHDATLAVVMAKVIFKTATTFNGYLADENHSLAWLFAVDHEGVEDNTAFLDTIGVIVEGSTTYQWVLRETKVLENPALWSTYFGSREMFVFTSRQLEIPDGADVRLVRGPVSDHIPAIMQAAGEKDVWLTGGGDLAGQFIDAGLLDEIELTVAPVALAGGAPLLPRRLESHSVRLADVERQGQFVVLRYVLQYA
jgi:dihydrofolate reductase